MLTRTDILEILANDVAEVTFVKKNGEERVMRCTLRDDLIEHVSNTSPLTPKKPNLNVVPAYDLDLGEWRSFRVDSVKLIVSPQTE